MPRFSAWFWLPPHRCRFTSARWRWRWRWRSASRRLADAALAFGLVAVSFMPGLRNDLSAYLFGDVLTVTRGDLVWIWAGALLVLAGLVWRWQALLTTTLNAELARAAGLDPRREELVLTLALALVVAVAIKIVGALMIAAMLIIPAATARSFARTPEGMAAGAVLAGMLAVLAGLAVSMRLDTPAGPSIVAVAAGLFALSLFALSLFELGLGRAGDPRPGTGTALGTALSGREQTSEGASDGQPPA